MFPLRLDYKGNTMMSQLTDTDRIKHMIKLAVDSSARVTMPVDSFFKAMGEESLGDISITSETGIVSALQSIQDRIDERLRSNEWRIIFGYDMAEKQVVWHLVSDRSWFYKNWKKIHVCSNKCPINKGQEV